MQIILFSIKTIAFLLLMCYNNIKKTICRLFGSIFEYIILILLLDNEGKYKLRILKSIYNCIVYNCPKVPPESGGILGGNKNIITTYMFDEGIKGNLYDEYIPNVDCINSTISMWQKQHIQFYGIYHSHFPGGDKLSISDEKYIEKIMKNMPYMDLFFPIVFPNKGMIVYRAELLSSKLRLSKESLLLIDKKMRSVFL